MTPFSLEAVLGVFLLFGTVPIIVLVGIIMLLKNRRYKIDQQSKLISQMIEKGEATAIDGVEMEEEIINWVDTGEAYDKAGGTIPARTPSGRSRRDPARRRHGAIRRSKHFPNAHGKK